MCWMENQSTFGAKFEQLSHKKEDTVCTLQKKSLILSPLKKWNEENRNTDIVEDEISCSWKWIGIYLRKLESVYLSWSLKGWWWGSW